MTFVGERTYQKKDFYVRQHTLLISAQEPTVCAASLSGVEVRIQVIDFNRKGRKWMKVTARGPLILF